MASDKWATRKFVLGIDLGTSSVKVSLVDASTGEVVKSLTRATKAAIPSDIGSMGKEQDPQKILTALQFCVSDFPKEDQMRVCCVAVSGQMHGVVFWKAGGSHTPGDGAWHRNTFGRFEVHVGPQKTSHLYTWEDERGTEEFLASLPKPNSHLRLATGHGCATIFWHQRNRPEFLTGYDRAGTIHDYVVAMLCDLPRPVMSIQNAASWGFFDTESMQWNLEILKSANFPVSILPEVCGTGSVAGKLQSLWYSIPSGTRVMIALGDLQCSILSSLQQENDAVLNLSTSAQLSFPIEGKFTPPAMAPRSPVEYFPYFDGKYIAVAASLTGGNVLSAFVTMLQQWTHEFGSGVPENIIWDHVLALGQECSSTDLVIVPTIHGERHKPEQRASVSGINSTNITLGEVCRAMCRGIATNLHEMMPDSFLKSHKVERIVGTGSSLTKNKVIKEEIERAYSLPIVYGKGSDAATGVAKAAIIALGVEL